MASLMQRLLFSLPEGLMLRLTGGAIERDGVRMDPRLTVIAHRIRAGRPATEMDLAEARRAFSDLKAFAAPRPEGVEVEDRDVKLSTGTRKVRIYRPTAQSDGVPLMVWFHMGGGVFGDLDTSDSFCALLASETGGVVASVDYRLAPEHKFPAGLKDAIAAYEWALGAAETLGAPAGRAAVGGDSIGGNFAAVICQEMRRDDLPQPALQLLVYPVLDMSKTMPADDVYGDIAFLDRATVDHYMAHYLPEGQDRAALRLSPAQTQDLEGLAPAIIATAGFDILREDGPDYARSLKGEMVTAEHVRYPTLPHGFLSFTGLSPAAMEAARDICRRVSVAYAKAG